MPGIGLLLLRILLAVSALAQGLLCARRGGSGFLLGTLLEVAAAGILIGLLTPGACAVAALIHATMAISSESAPALILAAGIAVALCFLGPGAFSLDAKLFGRREIVIPPPTTFEG